ncbi:MAG: hypothetical protein JXR70_03990 [Spirochaetales bacterium]|nr:hypothetical protein [Spirochaetales bacterium]
MISKIDILLAIHKRTTTLKSDSIPITQIQDDVMMSDSMFIDMVLQLDKQKLIAIFPDNTNWYRSFSENREKLFSKLTTTGKQKVLSHFKK